MVQAFVPPLPHHTRDLLGAQLDRVRQDGERDSGQSHDQTRTLLKRVLPIYAEIAPVDAAALVFAHGVAAVHHASTIHRFADPQTGETQARLILEEVYDQLDDLNDRSAERLLGLLMGAAKTS